MSLLTDRFVVKPFFEEFLRFFDQDKHIGNRGTYENLRRYYFAGNSVLWNEWRESKRDRNWRKEGRNKYPGYDSQIMENRLIIGLIIEWNSWSVPLWFLRVLYGAKRISSTLIKESSRRSSSRLSPVLCIQMSDWWNFWGYFQCYFKYLSSECYSEEDKWEIIWKQNLIQYVL